MEATVLRWHKQVGDFIKLDETLLDIATDKVDSEVPSTAEGILAEVLCKEMISSQLDLLLRGSKPMNLNKFP